MGRKPIKVFIYNKKGELFKKFNNIATFRDFYFPGDGKYPLLTEKLEGIGKHTFFNLKNKEMLAVDNPCGRDRAILAFKIKNSKLCKYSKKESFHFKNVKGEIVATFKNKKIANFLVPYVSERRMTYALTEKNEDFIIIEN